LSDTVNSVLLTINAQSQTVWGHVPQVPQWHDASADTLAHGLMRRCLKSPMSRMGVFYTRSCLSTQIRYRSQPGLYQ